MTVSNLMTQDVQRCAPHDSVHRAAQLMYERDCGSIVVVGRDGYVHGMITDRDVCIAAYRTERRLKDIPLSEVMSRNIKTCTPDTSVHDAERMMRMLRLRRLPVADEGGTLVGILTLTDLVRASLGADDLAKRDVFKTMGAVSLPDRPHA